MMKKPLHYLGAAALALAITGNVQAVSMTDLLDGGSITAGDKLLDQWTLIDWWGSDPALEPNTDGIDVTALADGGNDPGPGINIDFGDQMTVTGDGIYAFSDLTFGFRVSTLGGPIKDNTLDFGIDPGSSLLFEPDGFNDLGIAVQEWVYDIAGNLLAEKYIEASVLDDVLTALYPDSAQFAPQDEIFVEKNILVWSTDDTDTATLGSVVQRFSQVPEPATAVLLGLGLAGVGIARRRRD
jgi:hypothetical protein